MHTSIDRDLKDAFALRVSTIPSTTTERLRAIDYRPRNSRRVPLLTVGGLASTAVAGTVSAVVLIGGAQPAFAGWSAAPTPATDGQTAGVDATCLAKLNAQPDPGAPFGTDWSPIITDIRGPYAVVVFSDSSDDATCFTGPTFTALSRDSVGRNGKQTSSGSVEGSSSPGADGGGSSVAIGGSSGGLIPHMTDAHLNSGEPYTLIEGSAASGVTAVALIRSDGSQVVATVAGGWFLAWWPGTVEAASAVVTTSSGTTSVPLNFQTMPLPTPKSGSGASSS